MFSSFLALPPNDFAQSEFAACAVGDPRRRRRVVSVAAAMAANPGLSIPKLFAGDPYAINASYELFKREEATPDNLQAAHRHQTRRRCTEPGTYLLLEDTTDISYSGGEHREGLGPIGNRASNFYEGVRVHSVLAVRMAGEVTAEERRPAVEICGLLDQQYLIRSQEPLADPNPARGSRRKRLRGDQLESQRWIESIERSIVNDPSNGEVDAQARCIRVADREADIYEYLRQTRRSGQGFVVRACQNRRVQCPDTGRVCGHLLTLARERGVELGGFELFLRARPGMSARTARLRVSSAGEHLIQSPQRPGHGQGGDSPVAVSVVRVWEAEPSAGVKAPLEWLLLTSEPVATFEQALVVARQYACRWLIEEFHKALKSIMGAERLQLERGERLMAAIAIMSVVALRLIDLREAVRLWPDAPAIGRHFDEVEIEILESVTRKSIVTLRDGLRAMAKLGGFIGRKCDGEPGIQALWRGREVLDAQKRGYLLAIEHARRKRSRE